MFCLNQTNNMINQLYKKALRIVLIDQTSNFETLLVENSDIETFNHNRNFQTLVTEAYKTQNNLAPLVMETVCLQEKSFHIT